MTDPWTLEIVLEWEGGRPWVGRLKNRWRRCISLGGIVRIEVQLQNGDGGRYLLCDPGDLPSSRRTFGTGLQRVGIVAMR